MNTGPAQQHGSGQFASSGGQTFAQCETHHVALGPIAVNSSTMCPIGAIEEAKEEAIMEIHTLQEHAVLSVQHQQNAGMEALEDDRLLCVVEMIYTILDQVSEGLPIEDDMKLLDKHILELAERHIS